MPFYFTFNTQGAKKYVKRSDIERGPNSAGTEQEKVCTHAQMLVYGSFERLKIKKKKQKSTNVCVLVAGRSQGNISKDR